jgi:aspartyl-tRNA(Asn)/glutamyl-tRNA(Gln) amidotransferase subunit A
VHAAIHVLARITAGMRDVELPYTNVLLTIASAEAYAFHRPWFTQTPELYQAMTRQRLEQAASISAADYVNARREMERLRWQADSAFSSIDLLVTPTTAIAPISIASGNLDPLLPPDGTPREFRNTHMFDVLGLPAISVPCGFTRDGPSDCRCRAPARRVASTRAGACLPAAAIAHALGPGRSLTQSAA